MSPHDSAILRWFYNRYYTFRPWHLDLALPRFIRLRPTLGGTYHMALSLSFKGDQVATITILARSAGGTVVPLPSGDTLTAASADPAQVAATVGVDAHGSPALVLTPAVQVASTPVKVTVSDSAGLTPVEVDVTLTADETPASLDLDLQNVVFTSQQMPATPGS